MNWNDEETDVLLEGESATKENQRQEADDSESSPEVDEYRIGYGRPPRECQYPKGHSGNPRGRPKGSKNLGTRFQEALSELVQVTENGKVKHMSAIDVAIRTAVRKAAAGDLRAFKEVLAMARINEQQQEADETGTVIEEQDRRLYERMIQRAQERKSNNDPDNS